MRRTKLWPLKFRFPSHYHIGREKRKCQDIVGLMKPTTFVLLLCCVATACGQVVRHQGRFYYGDGTSSSVTDPSPALHKVQIGASETIEQISDHFDASNNGTFSQRYFVNETQWNRPDTAKWDKFSPVLLCVGGEGPPLDKSVLIDSVHCSDMITYSYYRKSLTFALEHRFYGSSSPADDYATDALNKYLSTEQAVQDIGEFIRQMKIKYNIPDSTPWITYGGSYPGMVAAIARQVLPDVVYAAVSSSAPIEASVAMPGYNEIVGLAYKTESVGGSQQCFDVIKKSHEVIGEMLTTNEGRRTLEKDFKVCGGEGALDNELNQSMFASSGVVYLPAQGNDPACTSPLCNIESICENLTQSKAATEYDTMVALSAQMSSSCKFVSHAAEILAFKEKASPSRVWEYQTCSEWGFYMTCESDECPFVQGLPALEAAIDICKHAYDIDSDAITKNIAAANERYGGLNFPATRVIFVNGEIDPWRANSVQKSPAASIAGSEPVHSTPGSSHHYWTHAPQESDNTDIVDARQAIIDQLDSWLFELESV